MLAEKRAILSKYAYIQTKQLKILHHYFDERTTYPRDPHFKSAIYDIDHRKIFSLLKANPESFSKEIYLTKKEGFIHFMKSLDEYYLGAKYLFIEIEDDGLWKQDISQRLFLYNSIGFIFFLLFGIYLANLFVKPMRDAILLLDRFIKDTTHELNTPLSAILANIEMMDTHQMIEKNKKKLNRINIAAKTVSVLYKDLTYMTLERESQKEKERIDLVTLIEDRVEYFEILAHSKAITIHLNLQEATLYIHKDKMVRIVDNLLSNAIKYNRRRGDIYITLTASQLTICDTGIGIAKEEIPFMFDRYMRFNKSEGGFGVGLSIVKQIADECHLTIEVTSIKEKGTCMEIQWKNKHLSS
jgi:two-component system OmpR family sensor kinase